MKSRFATLALLMQLAASLFAAEPALHVHDAWIRPAPPNAPVLAGYMSLENRSATPRTLLGASSRAFGRITIHRTEHAEGMTRMTHIADVAVPAHGKTVFEPGAYHLMLEQPKLALNAGDSVAVVLEFAGGSSVSATFQVREQDASAAHEHGAAHGSHASADRQRTQR